MGSQRIIREHLSKMWIGVKEKRTFPRRSPHAFPKLSIMVKNYSLSSHCMQAPCEVLHTPSLQMRKLACRSKMPQEGDGGVGRLHSRSHPSWRVVGPWHHVTFTTCQLLSHTGPHLILRVPVQEASCPPAWDPSHYPYLVLVPFLTQVSTQRSPPGRGCPPKLM